ncbi:MAG: hypothetical protein ABFC84_05705 [Veillonellales bacterium]
MLDVFREVQQKIAELEHLQIVARANEITYQQKGEIHTAERFHVLYNCLGKASSILKSGIGEEGIIDNKSR